MDSLMSDTNAKRIRILKIWEMLYNETDEDHPVSTEQIRARLKEYGIESDRRTIYDDIAVLEKSGYEIMRERGRSNLYYVEDRVFEPSEVMMLMTAVRATASITERKTEELLGKVSSLAGKPRGEILRRKTVEFDTVKSINEHIYFSIDRITNAIISGKKVSFNYFDYDENCQKAYRKDRRNPEINKLYTVNPVATVCSNDKYYLICYHDNHDELTHYRVDRMSGVEVLKANIKKNENAQEYQIKKHKLQLFGMYGGKEERVTIVADAKLLDVMYDKFGKTVTFSKTDNGKISFEAVVQLSPAFLAWCCSFGNKLKVTSPQSVVEEIKKYLKSTLNQY
ncbi:MAG: WYL domain-containing transcriptional regulator [Clostridia bacterium]|nr:WYL domain-containing transcriptional regulator [Clostridia bacterium]